MAKRKICVVTGSRAEYGLLRWLLEELRAMPGVRLQLVVTGMHLEARFGDTWREIEADGFAIDARVPMDLAGDSPAEAAAAATSGLDIGSIITSLISGGAGGAILTAIIGAIKNR